MLSQCHVVEKVFQNLRMRLKFRIRQAMKMLSLQLVKFVHFEIGIFSFNSYVYYLTRAFNLPTCAFNLATRAFTLLTSGFEHVAWELELVTRGFELVTRGFELATRELELVTRGF